MPKPKQTKYSFCFRILSATHFFFKKVWHTHYPQSLAVFCNLQMNRGNFIKVLMAKIYLYLLYIDTRGSTMKEMQKRKKEMKINFISMECCSCSCPFLFSHCIIVMMIIVSYISSFESNVSIIKIFWFVLLLNENEFQAKRMLPS